MGTMHIQSETQRRGQIIEAYKQTTGDWASGRNQKWPGPGKLRGGGLSCYAGEVSLVTTTVVISAGKVRPSPLLFLLPVKRSFLGQKGRIRKAHWHPLVHYFTNVDFLNRCKFILQSQAFTRNPVSAGVCSLPEKPHWNMPKKYKRGASENPW